MRFSEQVKTNPFSQNVDSSVPCTNVVPFQLLMRHERYAWELLEEEGGIERYVRGPFSKLRTTPPQNQMPVNGVRLDQVAFNTLPAKTGTDNLFLSYMVPRGWDGVITNNVNYFTPLSGGPSFTDGSGYLTWRLQINETWVKGMGNIQYTLGSLQNRNAGEGVFFQLFAGDLVRYFVSHSSASTLTFGMVGVAFSGYTYPSV